MTARVPQASRPASQGGEAVRPVRARRAHSRPPRRGIPPGWWPLTTRAGPPHRLSVPRRIARSPARASRHRPGANPRVPTLGALSFPASRFEREMHDFFGIVPADHPLPRRLARHAHWPSGWHPMLRDAGPPPFTENEPVPVRRRRGRRRLRDPRRPGARGTHRTGPLPLLGGRREHPQAQGAALVHPPGRREAVRGPRALGQPPLRSASWRHLRGARPGAHPRRRGRPRAGGAGSRPRAAGDPRRARASLQPRRRPRGPGKRRGLLARELACPADPRGLLRSTRRTRAPPSPGRHLPRRRRSRRPRSAARSPRSPPTSPTSRPSSAIR